MRSSQLLAIALQEQAIELSNSDVCASLCAELNDMFPGEYCYVCDVFGDDESGDVVYYCGGQKWRAPYEIGEINGKRSTAIDDDQAVEVVARTAYDEMADDDDNYAGMSETDAAEARTLGPDARRMLFFERFVSQAERDAADSSDFAGKGKSFPILKPGDVMAAVRSMGRAGSDNKSTDALKSSIIRIAKKKGWTKYLPKAWQGGTDSSEAATSNHGGALKLVERSDWKKDTALHLVESAGGSVRMPIKLIAPGTGSSAFYPAEVLKRDGPNVFTKGTHIYINHATSAEESARPEGDWHKLAGALESNAYWDESGKAGPGLYGSALFTSDYAPLVKEKAAFTGMSIRASGVAEAGKMRDGVPILKQLTGAESVDVVTRPGAGGMILTEAARPANLNQGGDMTPEEITKLVESAVAKAVTAAVAAVQTPVVSLTERALRGDAREEATRILEAVTLPEQSKRKVIEAALRETLPLKDGVLDVAKLTERINAEAKAEGQYVAELTGSGRVLGLGSSPVIEITGKEAKAARKAEKRAFKESRNVFEELMGDKKAAEFAVRGRAS